MKILSRFTDFYDSSPNLLGFQPDEKTTYIRGGVKCPKGTKIRDFCYLDFSGKIEESSLIGDVRKIVRKAFALDAWPEPSGIPDIKIFGIVVVDTMFIFISCNGKNFLASEFVKISEYREKIDREWNFTWPSKFDRYDKKKFEKEKWDVFSDCVPFSQKSLKLVGSPVFLLTSSGFVHEDVPCLRKLGLDRVLDIHQTYQKIEMAISSILFSNPDTAPLVEFSDKDKIESAGFDFKTSFRNPIK